MTKNINLFTADEIKSALNFDKIPGLNAQLEMAPSYRADLIKKNKEELTKSARIASVLILLYKEKNQWYFPVILRNIYKGVHSNQIGLPGGKIEESDGNLANTAIRESMEEINSNPNKIEILGNLTELYVPPSHIDVHPFVGIYHSEPDFIASESEVQKIIPINLSEFISTPNKTSVTINTSLGVAKEVPAFNLRDCEYDIWGTTAMILNEFHLFIKNSLNL